MTLKHFIAPALLLMAFSFWYCQKTPQSDLNSVVPAVSTSEERGELGCEISDPGEDPTCTAKIRARCITVAPGYTYDFWEVSGSWYALENGETQHFPFTISGGPGVGYQLGVWYDLPKPVIKQSLLDANCPGRENSIECIVYTGDDGGNTFNVTQWNMWVDIKSGGRTTTYYMNGATGVMTPVPLNGFPDPDFAFDRSDVDFLNNCSNMGAQGIMCNPITGCVECATSINDGHK